MGLAVAAVKAHDERFAGFQEIVLISDGDDPARDEEWRVGADAARRLGIPVHVVGIGDPETGSPIPAEGGPLRHDGAIVLTRLDEAPLEEIASRTGGTYTSARTRELKLGDLFHTSIEPRAVREAGEEGDALEVHRQRYPWFFGAALAFLTCPMLLHWPVRGARKTAEVQI
jgi:Ca-activated chloride channel family protein